MPAATRSIVIDTPPERLFDVIVDYDRYAEFLPEVKEARSRNRKGNEVDVDYGIDVVKRIHYTLHHVEERPRSVRWTFVKGELMRDNHGDWTLEATPDGKTRATYTIEVGVGPLVPRSIVNMLVDQSLPKLLEAFKKRAEAR
ncbi:MAG: SRPBCC family protein [Myxococcaceae bacterium]|nr:MAG: SRPBCC family protein [Myxococcaceae bacterium]